MKLVKRTFVTIDKYTYTDFFDASFSSFIEDHIGKQTWINKEILFLYAQKAASWIGDRLLNDVAKIRAVEKEGMIALYCFPRDNGKRI